MLVSVIGEGKGYRVFQIQKTGNRHLVDLRPVKILPESQPVDDVQIVSPPDLIAMKVASYHLRRGRPKSFSDRRDLAMLFLAFPELKRESGAVESSLKSLGVSKDVLNSWRELVAEEIPEADDDDEFNSFTA